MKFPIRPAIVVGGTALYSVAACALPVLVDGATIKYLLVVFGLLFSMLVVFFGQLGSVTGVGVLNSREMERYTAKKAAVRKRMWAVVAVCAVGSTVLWIVSMAPVSDYLAVQGGVVGLLVSFGISYLLAVARWINDLAAFSDHLRLLEQTRKEHESVVKRLADAAKQ